MIKVGFIDYYLDEWHANNYPEMFHKQSNGRIKVCYAYGMIESPITGMTSKQWCEKYGIEQCTTIEELVEKSDVILVLSPDNCEMHEELSRIPLTSGKRTYIDKTFAPTAEIAKRIFALAEAHNTPCYSSSALRFAAEYIPFAGEKIRSAAFWGPNGIETYCIHQLEPMLMLMKGRVKRAVALDDKGWDQVMFEFEDGRSASFVCTGAGAPFNSLLRTENGCSSVSVSSDFFAAFIDALIEFYENGTIPVSHEETIAIMEARELAIKAVNQPGEWVFAEA